MRFIITEEEKIRIKRLYEQSNILKNSQNPTANFTAEELKILNENKSFWKKDDFTNKPREANIICCWNYYITKTISKTPIYTLSFNSEKTANINPGKGLYILFEDGSKFMRPNEYVGKSYRKGWEYYSSFNLSQQDLQTFITKKIKKYRLYDVDSSPSSECSEDLKVSLIALSKLTSQDFDYILSGGVDKDYSQDPNKSDEKVTTEPDLLASFPGGKNKMISYVTKYLTGKIPKGSYEIKMNIKISKDGIAEDIEIISPKNNSNDKLFIDMFKEGPKWSPAVFDGRQVDSIFKFDVNITI